VGYSQTLPARRENSLLTGSFFMGYQNQINQIYIREKSNKKRRGNQIKEIEINTLVTNNYFNFLQIFY
jgi:hypothetical protein